MKVHLIKTPEYKTIDFTNVVEFLTSFNGPIEFCKSEFKFDESLFPFLQKFYPDFKFRYESDIQKIDYDPERSYPLSWKELFSLCQYFRVKKSIPDYDFVVLLTVRRNTLNWFSAQIGQDVFVHTGDWDYYTNSNPKYPIAYQIIENIMESLMKIDVDNPNENAHIHPRGCMNDFCQNKSQVMLKLRTADICTECMEKIYNEKIDERIISQVDEIFEGIRQELLFKLKFKTPLEPVQIIVTRDNKIFLPFLKNLEIRLNPLFKTVYVFYLNHPEGVKLVDLSDYKNELIDIYGRLSVADDNETIQHNIANLINPLSNSFSQKKSKINKIIKELLGKHLSKYYIIGGIRGEPFKINLPTKLIEILK